MSQVLAVLTGVMLFWLVVMHESVANIARQAERSIPSDKV